MVDSRWTVKVSFFGLHSLTNAANMDDCGDDENRYADCLWTAPELLRMCGFAPPAGTEKGDVYSFGMVLQGILFRNTLFSYSEMSSKGNRYIINVDDNVVVKAIILREVN